MLLKEITDHLESIAPLSLQESYDNAGLIVGDENMEISGALCTLDSTEEVIDQAIDLGYNLVVAHHPIIFGGIKKFSDYYVHRVIKKAIKNDIAIYAIHTNLDNVLNNGVNQNIANALGLKGLSILRKKENLQYPDKEIGSGIIGCFDSAVSEEKVLALVKSKLSCGVIKHTKLIGKKVKKIAICGGSGSFLLKDAIRSEANVFITSDFKYHEFFDADGKIVIMDIGHYETEHLTKNLLSEILCKKFYNFAAQYSNLNTNPVNYY
ncbi:MAG: Nif3-like dinuclear metal center hexameric protein [Saprospiraceae bacterium]